MPEELGTPRGFSFATQDRSVQLTLQFEEGAPSPGAPPFEELLPPQEPDASLERMDEEEQPFSSGGLRGTTRRWELRSLRERRELETYAVQQLSVLLSGGETFRALGIARGPGRATLQSIWAQLTTTLRLGA